jgi:protein-S-isoprenylcysteine O-methyltransferase Ste14
MDAPPSTSLTEYERITVRYQLVKLLFVPMMVSFCFNNLQSLISDAQSPFGDFDLSSPSFIRHVYLTVFMALMMIDVVWFATCCTMETGRFSPVKIVDPYAAGWLITLACYPPLVQVAGQFMSWSPPEFPDVQGGAVGVSYAIAGIVLFAFYLVADLSFGLKCGNLTYRGLVDKGPYRLIRHPMYASKNLAWCLFTIPALGFHWTLNQSIIGSTLITYPGLAGNWGMIWPMIGWMTIYALRGITEERYLLRFPEYREYCKRVRYRFIPGLI